MDLSHFFSIIMNLSTLVFVVTSILAMGLSLTVAQIVAPLRNPRLVLAALLFLLSCFTTGFLLGGRQDSIRPVVALGTTQRNLAADDPDVLVMILVLGLVDLSVLLFTANLLVRRNYDPQLAG